MNDVGTHEPQKLGNPKEQFALCQRKSGQYATLFMVAIASGVILFAGGLAAEVKALQEQERLDWWSLLAGAGLVCLASAPALKSRFRDWSNRLDDAEFDLDLSRLEREPPEAKADRLWRMNQRQLRRYHEANLQQNAWVIATGIGCILLGVGLIVLTLFLLKDAAAATAKVVAGSVGAVLTNFVAAIFLKMHAGTARNLTDFHDKLVTAQRLFLSNMIASQVGPAEKRSELYGKLSLALAELSRAESAPNGKSEE